MDRITKQSPNGTPASSCDTITNPTSAAPSNGTAQTGWLSSALAVWVRNDDPSGRTGLAAERDNVHTAH
jgi:hypothetical protein